MNELHSWLYTLFICGCLVSVIGYLAPEGTHKAIIEMGCSCVMILALLMPLRQFDLNDYLTDLTEYQEQIRKEISFHNLNVDEFRKTIIEEKYAEYIMNEAKQMDETVQAVSVMVRQDENGNYVPDYVIYYSPSNPSKTVLEHVEEQLGVPEERQVVYEDTEEYE